MANIQEILDEFDEEMRITRRLLERVPDGNNDWKPHPKSTPLGNLTMLVAVLPAWSVQTIQDTELDLNPPGGQPAGPKLETTDELLALFDASIAKGREAINRASAKDLRASWTLKDGGKAVMTRPRLAVLRFYVLNHLVHHRGQLSVYLRMLDAEIPAIYGPSADTDWSEASEEREMSEAGVAR